MHREDVKSVLLLFLMILTLFPFPAVAATVIAGTVTGVVGNVTARQTGRELTRILKRGDRIQVADVLETGSDSRLQLLLSDGTVLTLSPGTTACISQYSYDAAANRRTGVVNLKQGTLRLIITDLRSDGSRLAVETGQALMVASLADAVVETVPGKTVVSALSGSASVRNRSNVVIGSVSVGENLSTVVTTKEPPTIPTLVSQQQRRKYTRDARFF